MLCQSLYIWHTLTVSYFYYQLSTFLFLMQLWSLDYLLHGFGKAQTSAAAKEQW